MQRAGRFLFVVFAVLFLAATSQTNSTAEAQQKPAFVRLDRVTASRPTANGIEIRSGSAVVQITALRDDVIRVRVGPTGQLPEDASWAVSAAARAASVSVTQESNSTSVGFRTTKLHVSVRKDPLELTVTDMQGRVIAAQLPGRPIEYNGAAFRVYMKSPEDEHYFGLGDKPGPLDRRNEAFSDWNTDAFGWQESTDPIYKSIPYFMTFHKGVAAGVFLDNAARQLRLQQGISRRLLIRIGRWSAGLLHPLWTRTKDSRADLGMAHRSDSVAPVVVAGLSAVPIQLLPRGRSAPDRGQVAK